ncbi:MAG TPA: 3-oxoacyl-ACP reductase family protein [Terracidiphilus sp.]|nr:3-oxoacyl-ACP reductase family protein [Terracidiphilus sp.]
MAVATFPVTEFAAARPLAEKVVLVTGGSRGIGHAVCRELSERGATVAINFRQSRALAENFCEELVHSGADCEIFQGDVSDRVQARKVVHDVLDRFHHVDVLVNNAGITRDHSFRKMTDEEWREVIETNLNSVFYCTSAVLPGMIEQNYGRIINIASFVGQAGNFGQVNYAASKGAVIAMTKALALEVAKYNITVNAIAPGFTSTDMVSAIPGEIQEQLKSRIPMHRFAEPEEIAKAAAFLVCDGDYITGQQINVNGGIYM